MVRVNPKGFFKGSGLIRVDIIGAKKLEQTLKKMGQRVKPEYKKLALRVHNRFKKNLYKNIDKLSHDNSRSHSTPVPLRSLVKYGKRTKAGDLGYWVGMTRTSRYSPSPVAVELGTEPHSIVWGRLKRPKQQQRIWQHPGSKPRYFWRDAWNQTLKEVEPEFKTMKNKIVNEVKTAIPFGTRG